jgi:hypothetical protein
MKKMLSSLLGLGLLAATLSGQDAKKPASPHETTSAVVGGKKITITYGRPYVKGRNVWEGSLAPYGKVWRTGADDATTITVEGDTMLGSLHVPAGTYSLFTIPGEKEWTLILNKTAKQWGAYNYDEKQDLGRAKMTAKKLASPIEQLTIAVVPGSGSNATLKISWSDAEASIPVMVH